MQKNMIKIQWVVWFVNSWTIVSYYFYQTLISIWSFLLFSHSLYIYQEKEFLYDKLRKHCTCFHMIIYCHSNRWITTPFHVNRRFKCDDHPMCVDSSSMLVKYAQIGLIARLLFFEHILTMKDASTYFERSWYV